MLTVDVGETAAGLVRRQYRKSVGDQGERFLLNARPDNISVKNANRYPLPGIRNFGLFVGRTAVRDCRCSIRSTRSNFRVLG